MEIMKTCTKCGRQFPLSNFYKHHSCKHGVTSQCKECIDDRNRKWRQEHPDKWSAITGKYNKKIRKKTKNECLKYISGGVVCCARCGFTDIRALQIDHIHGGGSKENKKFHTTYDFHKYILSLSENVVKNKYQILCANCNWIKVYENKEFSRHRKYPVRNTS